MYKQTDIHQYDTDHLLLEQNNQPQPQNQVNLRMKNPQQNGLSFSM